MKITVFLFALVCLTVAEAFTMPKFNLRSSLTNMEPHMRRRGSRGAFNNPPGNSPNTESKPSMPYPQKKFEMDDKKVEEILAFIDKTYYNMQDLPEVSSTQNASLVRKEFVKDFMMEMKKLCPRNKNKQKFDKYNKGDGFDNGMKRPNRPDGPMIGNSGRKPVVRPPRVFDDNGEFLYNQPSVSSIFGGNENGRPPSGFPSFDQSGSRPQGFPSFGGNGSPPGVRPSLMGGSSPFQQNGGPQGSPFAENDGNSNDDFESSQSFSGNPFEENSQSASNIFDGASQPFSGNPFEENSQSSSNIFDGAPQPFSGNPSEENSQSASNIFDGAPQPFSGNPFEENSQSSSNIFHGVGEENVDLPSNNAYTTMPEAAPEENEDSNAGSGLDLSNLFSNNNRLMNMMGMFNNLFGKNK